MTYLLYSCGFMLSAVAAYYSVMGLIAIFSTAIIPIAIMGSVLEISKLVSASWLYRNWNTAPKMLKYYFTVAVTVLMLLTSMGIFGYLSKAHLDQAVPTGDVASQVAILDEKIKTEKENIDAARKALTQLDSQVDQTISRTTEASGADRAVAIRRGQAKERASLQAEIATSQAKIGKLREERAPIASELRKVEAEVGPIKYIAALIYGDTLDDTLLESAVRIVILLIIFVFDPLAVLLLIAASRESMLKHKIEEVEPEPIYVADVTMPEPDYPHVYPDMSVWKDVVEQLSKEREEPEVEVEAAPIIEPPIEQVFFEAAKEQAKELDETATIDWEIAQPPKETPDEFTKVVQEYFHPEDEAKETMLYVNEEPEPSFVLNPDFNQKDPFMEKPRPKVMPDSRTENR
jgi:hypothetical protein